MLKIGSKTVHSGPCIMVNFKAFGHELCRLKINSTYQITLVSFINIDEKLGE